MVDEPPLLVPDISFESGAETELTLPSGSEFNVIWDPLSPWKYVPVDTQSVQSVSTGNGLTRFRVTEQIPSWSSAEVIVQALDENNDVMGEHKITVLGP